MTWCLTHAVPSQEPPRDEDDDDRLDELNCGNIRDVIRIAGAIVKDYRRAMRRLDAFLIDAVHQPICNALYERVGDCIVIARWVLAQVIGLTVCAVILYVLQHPINLFATIDLGANALIICTMFFCRLALRWYLGLSGLNPLRYIIFPMRLFLLCLMIPITVGTLALMILFVPDGLDTLRMSVEMIRDVVMLSGFYFASCHNLPPPRRVTAPAHVWS